MAANLIVTRSTSFFQDNDEQGIYDVGDTLYTRVTITNNGDANATNVTFEDTFTGTTLVPGKFNISPLAFNDTFEAIGNTVLRVGTADTINGGESKFVSGNLLSNDQGNLGGVDDVPGFQIVAVSNGVSANGGTFNIFGDGTFNYVNDGTDATLTTDSFTYTIRDAGLDGVAGNADDLTSTATVTITFAAQSPGGPAHRVWYVDGSAAPGGDGTSAKPFQNLSQLNGVGGAGDRDAAGEIIYVEGTVSGPIALEASQQLIGDGAALIVAGTTLATAGANSTLAGVSGQTTVVLSTGNTIAGLNIGSGTGTGNGISGSNFGTLTVNNATINAAGQALDLTNGTFAGSGFTSTESDGGSMNVSLVNVSGTVALGSGALAGAGTHAINIANTGGAAVNTGLTYSGSVTHSGTGALLNVAGGTAGHSGTVALSGGLTATAGTGLQFNNADGTYNLSGLVSLTGSGEAGIDIVSGSSGTFTFGTAANQATVTNNSGGDAFVVTGSNATVTYNGAITDNNGNAVFLNANTGGTITFQNGSINSTAGGIDVTSNTGGTTNFNSQVALSTGANTGVNLTSNTGATVNFNASGSGLDITTTTGVGFNATGGGTVTVATGGGNSITSVGGTALNVANTTIGAGGLNFVSISANGGVNGIVLNTTGNVAGLTVTGDGTAANNGSGGTIQNSTGSGVVIDGARNVSLNQMNVTNSGIDGLNINNIDGLTLNRLTITDNSSTSLNNAHQGIEIGNFSTGTAVNGAINITNTSVTYSSHNNLSVGIGSGTSTWNISNSTFSFSGGNGAGDGSADVAGNSGVAFELRGGAVVSSLLVNANTFEGNYATGMQISNSADATGNLKATITNNTFKNNNIGMDLNALGAANMTYVVTGNSVVNDTRRATSGIDGTSHAVNVFQGTPSTGTLNLYFSGNTIGNNSIDGSGSSFGNGLRANFNSNGLGVVQISNNFIYETPVGRGIEVIGRNGTGRLDVTITNNTVDHINLPFNTNSGSDFPLAAILVQSNNTGGGAYTVRSDVRGNTVPGGASSDVGAGFIHLDLAGASVHQLVDNPVGPAGQTAQQQLASTNTGSTSADATVVLISGPISTPPQSMMVESAPVETHAEGEAGQTPHVDNSETGGTQDNQQHGEPVPAEDAPAQPVVVDDGIISQAELDLIVEAAIQRWISAGATEAQVAAMRAVSVTVAELGGLTLGESGLGTITLDTDAAGWRWFVDATPGDDSEYAGSGTQLKAADRYSLAGTRIDLLTVVTHELGHQIGLSDTYAPGETDELMYGTIGAGERRLPGADDLHYAADGPVAGAFAFAPISLGTIEPGKIVVVEWRHTVDSPGEDRLAGYWSGQTIVTYEGGTVSPTTTLSNAESGIIDSLSLGNLVYVDADKNGFFNAGDTGVAGVTLSLFADTNNDGDYDAGIDLAIVYEDVNGNSQYDQGIDNPLAPGSTGTNVRQLTATTGANGVYAFTSLAPGDYIVVVNASNFQAGGALLGKVSHGNPADPNAVPAVDGDNDGEQFLIGQAGTYAASRAIRLDYGQEPGGDVNNTLDLGFDQPNQAPAVTNLQGNGATFTEGDTLVRLDVGGDAVVSDADSANFNGGSLLVSITSNKDASEDQLAIDQNGTGVTVADGVVSVDGIAIGLVTGGGSGGGDLKIDLNSDAATPAAVQKVVRALAYFNTDTNGPSAATRGVSITLVDGDGRDNGGDDDVVITTSIQVVPVNDAPSGADNEKVINEDATYTFVYVPGGTNDFGFTDADGHSFAGIRVVTLPALGTLTLNGNPVAADAVVSALDIQDGKLKYTPAQDGSGNDYASFTFKVIDSGLGTSPDVNEDPTANTFIFDVTAVNDAPVLDLNGAAAGDGASGTAAEQVATGTGSLASAATVTDVDSANFDTGTLTVSITANAQAGDIVSVQNYSDGSGNALTVAENAISYNGVVVATFTAGNHGTPLVVTFDADATAAAVQFVTRAVYFAHTGDAPSASARTLTYTLTDGDGGSDSATASVSVAPRNDAPDLSAPTAATIGYTEGAAAVKLMQGVTLVDPDQPANFAGGSLTVSVSGVGGGVNVDLTSNFKINDNGNGTFSLAYQDGQTQIAIGTITGFGTPSLTVSNFAVGATPARLNELVVAFTYVNSNDNPGSADRTVTMTFNDGNNTGSGSDVALTDTVTQTLQITPVNDGPDVDANGADPGNGTAAYTENAAPVALAPGLVVSDPDDTMLDGAYAVINDLAAGDSLTIGGLTQGTTGTGGAISFSYDAVTGELTLTGSATKADYQAALRQVAFSSTSDAPGASRSIYFTLNDGEFQANGTNVDLTITQVNDAPTGANDSITTSEDDAYTFALSDFVFNDVDGHSLSGVRITELPAKGQLRLNGNPVADEQVIAAADIPNLTYVPAADENASPYTTFKFKVIDTGGTANGGVNESAEQTMTVNVTPDNLAPAVDLNGGGNGVDYATSYGEGGSAAAIGSGITVTDPDSGAGDQIESATVTITDAVAGDALTLSGALPSGITVDPTSTATTLKLTGAASHADYQAALALVRYSSSSENPAASGTDTQRSITVVVNDGVANSAAATATIDIVGINDGPVNTVPGAQNATEDTDLVFSGANAITVADADAGGGDMTVTLSVSNGRLTLATQAGLTSVSNDGTASVTLTGSAAEINAALNGLRYRGNLNFEGADTLTIVTSDNGLSGDGGEKTDTDQVAITVADDGFINGDSGNNVLTGTPQRDIFLVQQGGNDTVNGLAGNDTFYFGASFTAADTVNGGGGPDVLVLQGNYSAGVTLGTGTTSNITGLESISLFSGSLTLYGDLAGNSYSYNLTTLDSNVARNEFLRVNGSGLLAGENMTFNGSAETDGYFILFGGKGTDLLTGGANSDSFIFAHEGRFGAGDVVNGGAGYDFMYLRGDYEIDFNDVGYAGSLIGIESVGLLSFTDNQYAGGGDGEFDYDITWNDSMLGAGQTITFNGSRLTASETMIFDGGDETNGSFRLFAGAANDDLEGGDGADLIYGGLGADILTGNGGADTFRYHDTAESTQSSRDEIQDFEHNVDRIDLSRIDAMSFSGGDQSFSFIGAAAFSTGGNSSAGQLRAFQVNAQSNLWRVEGDVNGDGTPDLVIDVYVEAGQSLTASDFVL